MNEKQLNYWRKQATKEWKFRVLSDALDRGYRDGRWMFGRPTESLIRWYAGKANVGPWFPFFRQNYLLSYSLGQFTAVQEIRDAFSSMKDEVTHFSLRPGDQSS